MLELEVLEDRYLLSGFSVSGGQILDPTGNVWIAKGINYPDGVSGVQGAQQVINLFPGITFVRLGISDGFPSPASLAPFINSLTSHGIVVEIEDHNYPLHNPDTGATLQQEVNWYTSLASYYTGNPYVWFGTQNEPQSSTGLTNEEVAVYNAVRGAGNTAPIILEAGPQGAGPGSPGSAGLIPTAYTNMQDVIFDIHYSGGDTPNLTSQTSINNALAASITATRQIHSADGIIPVIVGETSPSTDGTTLDPNGQHAIYASTTWALAAGLSSGFAGWYWGTDPNDLDSMTHDGVTLTSWGQEMHSIIQSPLTLAPPPTVTSLASASPKPVTGTSTTLSVTATDPSNHNLTYQWLVLSAPSGATAPTFSNNNRTLASGSPDSTGVTFHQAGTYKFRVTIFDASGGITTSDVSVTVKQTQTSLSISPSSVKVSDGHSQTFKATLRDQFGKAMATQPTSGFTWSKSGLGTLSTSTGRTVTYTAPSSGSGTTTIKATYNGLTGTATVTYATQ